MANICNTTYVLTGDKKRLEEVYNEVNKIMLDTAKSKEIEYVELKTLFRQVDPTNSERIIHINKDFDAKEPTVTIETENKWTRDDSTPLSFRTLYPELKVWFLSEELGYGIYETNDAEGKYIPKHHHQFRMEKENIEFLNRVEIIGIVGATKRETIGDKTLLRLSVATNYAYMHEEGMPVIETTWHNITFWENAETNDMHEIRKGNIIHITGRIRNTRNTSPEGNDRPCTEIIASRIEILTTAIPILDQKDPQIKL